MIEKAVLDSLEERDAVLFVGKNSRRLEVPKHLLPKHAKEGSRLNVIYDGHELIRIEIEREATQPARKRLKQIAEK